MGIGITNPAYALDVNGHIGIPTNKFIHFTRYRTNGDAFCIGMAGGNEVFRFVGADDSGNNRISYFGYYTGDSTANTWNAQLQINHQTGAAYNKANTWGNSSDINIKENIEDTRSYLEDICKLRVVKYSLKEDKLQAPNMIGVIAQEVEQIFPNLVDTINNIKCVKHSVINVILLKAFQEQNKIVQQQAIQLASQASEIATLKEQMATVLAKFS